MSSPGSKIEYKRASERCVSDALIDIMQLYFNTQTHTHAHVQQMKQRVHNKLLVALAKKTPIVEDHRTNTQVHTHAYTLLPKCVIVI